MVADQPWEALADALLRREVAVTRLVEGVPPRDLAGLVVTDDDVDRAMATLDRESADGREALSRVLDHYAGPVQHARDTFRAAVADGSPFAHLVATASLDATSAEVLALVAAVDLDPRRQRLVQYVQDDVQLQRPTLRTLQLVGARDGATWVRRVAPGSPLCRLHLLHVDEDGPWSVRRCGLPVRVAWHLAGDTSIDPQLPAGARVVPGAGGPMPWRGMVLVHGADRVSRQRAALDRWPGAPVVVCGPPAGAQEWGALVREATCSEAVIVVEIDEPLDALGRQVLERADCVPVVLSSSGELPLESLPERAWTEVAVRSGDADAEDWQAVLGRERDPALRLSREQLQLVASAAVADGGELQAAVRRLAGGHLDRLAVRIRPRRTWQDLVLPPDQEEQLRELVARYRHRRKVHEQWGFASLPSTGVIALFAGASGTGKTLAAEVLAGDLGLDVYRVDLSAVVSKYIGETEKNLEMIFTAAAAADLVLFFDEADALFGKRSEVSDAHDRYANIEVAYLLQRLERHEGLVVLATNLQRNIDPAFTRRISVAIDFPAPDEEQRLAIWSRAFPATAPVEQLDLEFLARQFKVTGGVIAGAALGAAFRAADAGTSIGMEHVVMALRREFQKLGRLRTEAEFGRYFPLVTGGTGAAPAR